MENDHETDSNTVDNRATSGKTQRTPSVTFGGVHLLATPDLTEPIPEKDDFDPTRIPSSILRRKSNIAMDSGIPATSIDVQPATPTVDTMIPRREAENKARALLTEETLTLPTRPTNRSRIEKSFVNFVVIGHVDSGKSTLIGHLVYLCNGIDKETMNRLAREADLAGKASFKYAWVMDKLKGERQRGISIDSKLRRFETPNNYVVIIDSPGHRDYVHNMITGASQADVAILVISAEKGEFEQGVKRRGQTREHLQVAYSFGVKQLIIVINKMETTSPPYSETRYNNIIKVLTPMIKRIGFDPDAIAFLPISAFDGDNLVTKSPNMPWFHMWRVKRGSGGAGGHTLLEAMDQVDTPVRMQHRPLRVPIHSVYKLGDIGIVTAGRIHSGCLRPNMAVTFAPNGVKAKVRAVQVFREVMTEVHAGDNVGIQIENLGLKDIKKGDVCGDPEEDPPRQVGKFTAQILVLNHPGQIKKGYTPLLNVHTANVACKFVDIKERCDRRTGEMAEQSPSCLLPGQVGVVEMVPMKPLCVESFFDYPSLGRIVIRDLKQTVAVGVVIDVDGRSTRTDSDKMKGQSRFVSNNFGNDSQLDNLTLGPDSRPVTAGDPQTVKTDEMETSSPVIIKTDPGEPEIAADCDQPPLTDDSKIDTLKTDKVTFRTGSGKLESEL
ncbi:elongation factor 1-alpha, somatic form-like [Ylistrum balloti]|uniref:elongation factor 1-alpha, somatic form-like n=1 Tax=Ylistrum balloti TaxID=509963 RepID=UPI002905D1D5|nr:elongation factor 1-alpha, somatic form-like [Ylistrum balloti]